MRYVDVRLLPCPEAPERAGQCEGPALIEILWQGRVVESFELRAGDELAVVDGAEVAPDTELLANDPWSRSVRAAIPPGVDAVARWSEPIEEVMDEVTGLTRSHFARGPVTLWLAAGGEVLATHTFERDVFPRIEHGATVRRGDRLATVPRYRTHRELEAGIETIRAWLDTRPLESEPRAIIAPCRS